MNKPTQILEISSFHQNCIIKWKQEGVTLCQDNFFRLVEENHVSPSKAGVMQFQQYFGCARYQTFS